ncbi:MAG: hypothetical protein WC824_15950 [Bacteroidota bacterium]|jgi:hypothetical protein
MKYLFSKYLWRILGGIEGETRQIYQMGFRSKDSRWLPGRWITFKALSEWEWTQIRDRQIFLYGKIVQQPPSQETLPKDMDPAQRQAWEFNSGITVIICTSPCQANDHKWVKTAGGKISVRDLKMLRKNKYIVLSSYQDRQGKTLCQDLDALGVPLESRG